MNVIRMIKLFGWEPRIKEQLLQKRAEELAYVKKSKIIKMVTGYVTYESIF